jgi:hypothetical protein
MVVCVISFPKPNLPNLLNPTENNFPSAFKNLKKKKNKLKKIKKKLKKN